LHFEQVEKRFVILVAKEQRAVENVFSVTYTVLWGGGGEQ